MIRVRIEQLKTLSNVLDARLETDITIAQRADAGLVIAAEPTIGLSVIVISPHGGIELARVKSSSALPET
jgi:hypothetical protein